MENGIDRSRPTGSSTEGSTPADAEFDPPFDVVEPTALTQSVVLSSPHSGDIYPPRFLASARLDAMALRRSEDAFVDQLVIGAVAGGMPLLRARFPRAYLDANREPYELDPRMFDGRLPPYVNTRSLRVAGGLGTIARVVGEAQEIYAKRLTVEEGIRRIDCLYKPYHAALRHLLDRAVLRFGQTLLVDCHSMPSSQAFCPQANAGRDERLKADFVIGDRFGTSCARIIADHADRLLSGYGYTVERNKPYAGGFITEHYGHPAGGRHALQVEVNRALYMNERSITPNDDFATIASHLAQVMAGLAELMRGLSSGERIAAE
jgi:N-formylglutamate amidohydrolase